MTNKNKEIEERLKEEVERLNKEIKDINERAWIMSEFIKILLRGHQTERKHKNIYNLMYKKLRGLSKELDKQN